MLKLYNTLTRKKEAFKPLHKKEVRIYSCGPTVYDYAHIGNFRAYVCSDLLKRYLLFCGYKVKHIMNLTDVDDKTIKRSREENVSLSALTKKYANAFFEDLKILKIEPADVFPKATEHIKEMVELINSLLKKKYAYISNDGIYYNISKFKNYGKLSHVKIKKLKAGARVKQDQYEKEQARDFALWKSWTKEDGNIFWNAQFIADSTKKIIKGRPGWHIECSVMSIKYLGQPFDIHTGGIDLIFPHHENEIAQSEAALGKKFVKYWFHNKWLLVEGKKMSKSLGNFYTLRDLLAKGYDARAIRLELMSAHYRDELNFTFSGLDASKTRIDRIGSFMKRLKEAKGKESKKVSSLVKKTKEQIINAMDNDIDVPRALEIFFVFIRDANTLMGKGEISSKQAQAILAFLKKVDSVFAILPEEKERKIPSVIKKLVAKREKARKKGNWKEADSIREQLKYKGWWIDDTPQGPRIRFIKG